MREERELVKRSHLFSSINRDDRILIYLKDKNTIIAEYDVSEISQLPSSIKIKFEPIYNAPPSSGVKITDLILMQLTTHPSVTEWKYLLRKPLTQITDTDYNTIIKKLII